MSPSAAFFSLLLALLAARCHGNALTMNRASLSRCDELSRLIRRLDTQFPDESVSRAGSFVSLALTQVSSLQSRLHRGVADYFRLIDRRLSTEVASTFSHFHIRNPLLESAGQTMEDQLCIARRILQDVAIDWSEAESSVPEMRSLNVTSRLLEEPSCFLRLAQEAIALTDRGEACRRRRLFLPLPSLDENNYLDLAYHRVHKMLGFLLDSSSPLAGLSAVPLHSVLACNCGSLEAEEGVTEYPACIE